MEFVLVFIYRGSEWIWIFTEEISVFSLITRKCRPEESPSQDTFQAVTLTEFGVFYSTCFPDTGQNPVSFRLISYPLCTKIVIAQTENGILTWIVEKDVTVIKVIWLLQNILDNLFLTEKFDDICNWLIFASFGLFWSVNFGRILHKFEEFSHRLLKHVLFLTNIWHVDRKT